VLVSICRTSGDGGSYTVATWESTVLPIPWWQPWRARKSFFRVVEHAIRVIHDKERMRLVAEASIDLAGDLHG
jgi:hypothetical protein